MYIVGIEGLVRAGKSTLAARLAARLLAKLILEYGVYSGGSATFPKYPPESYSEAVKSISYFIDIEARRVSDIQHEDKLVVVDRTYLTCLAFDFAARHFTDFDIYEEARRSWASAEKIEPNLIIFLDVSDEELDLRIAPDKHKYLPHFFQPSFNSFMRQFYSMESEQDNRMLRIDADQAIEVVQEQALQIVLERTVGGK